MLNDIVRAREVIAIWSVGFNLTFDVHEKKPDTLILLNSSFCFMCSISMPYLLIKTSFHFKTRKFWSTYKNSWTAPAWAVIHKCPVCADLLPVGRRSERLCRRLVAISSYAVNNATMVCIWRNDVMTQSPNDDQITNPRFPQYKQLLGSAFDSSTHSPS